MKLLTSSAEQSGKKMAGIESRKAWNEFKASSSVSPDSKRNKIIEMRSVINIDGRTLERGVASRCEVAIGREKDTYFFLTTNA